MSNTYMPLYGVFDIASGALQGLCPVSGVISSISGNPVSITGTSSVGSVLTAAPASGWVAGGYQWTRDGTNITGATSATYTLVSADSGHTLAVAVTSLTYTPTGRTISGSVIVVYDGGTASSTDATATDGGTSSSTDAAAVDGGTATSTP